MKVYKQKHNNVQKLTQNALLAYFDKNLKKSVANIKENIDVSKYPKLLAFIIFRFRYCC